MDNCMKAIKKVFCKKDKIINDDNASDLDFIELLLEYNVLNNNIKNDIKQNDELKVNQQNEINYFYGILESYVNDLFYEKDYITIKNKNNVVGEEEEEKVYKNEYEKIVTYILEYKIIIRNKSFTELLEAIKVFNKFEKERIQFIENLKNMDINKILESIDESYVKEYKNGASKIIIDLRSIVPYFNLYDYLMTFEREKCKIVIESNRIFVHYHLKNNIFKLELKNIYSNEMDYPIFMYKNEYKKYMFHNYNDTYNVALKKVNGYFAYPLYVENKYLEHIFKYHNVNIFLELRKKYKNYVFNTFLQTFGNSSYYYLAME